MSAIVYSHRSCSDFNVGRKMEFDYNGQFPGSPWQIFSDLDYIADARFDVCHRTLLPNVPSVEFPQRQKVLISPPHPISIERSNAGKPSLEQSSSSSPFSIILQSARTRNSRMTGINGQKIRRSQGSNRKVTVRNISQRARVHDVFDFIKQHLELLAGEQEYTGCAI